MPASCPPIAHTDAPRDNADVRGLRNLWEQTQGDPRVVIAILDGPVDRSNPVLRGVAIDQEFLDPRAGEDACSFQHGTEIASVIFARHDTGIHGIAPGCRGLSIPIFECSPADRAATVQTNLAAAIRRARVAGAHVINISAGQLALPHLADPVLLDAVRDCAATGILIVAAAGNDGCECSHLPAALPGVLSVGAMSADGRPLENSNWGEAYRTSGILAPGGMAVAMPDGRSAWRVGTSYATAIVSGIAGLLLSRELKLGGQANAMAIREALLAAASPCEEDDADCRRILAGRLNITTTMTYLDDRRVHMSDHTRFDTAHATVPSSLASDVSGIDPASNSAFSGGIEPSSSVPGMQIDSTALVQPSACSGCSGERQLVYALGQLGYDFGSEAGMDSFKQHMAQAGVGNNPLDEGQMLQFLRNSDPWHAISLLWTLNMNDTPIYCIRPLGPFAAEGYKRLLDFLDDQLNHAAERIAVPGAVVGQATLLSGRTVPIIDPDLRGFCNWTTQALIDAVKQARPADKDDGSLTEAIRSFLDRVYFEMQNSGLAPQERAINYAGTNLFEYPKVFSRLGKNTALDTIRVDKSSLCRPASDCWDITLAFFDPEQPMQTVQQIFRYTVDVSQPLPVNVGELRHWAART